MNLLHKLNHYNIMTLSLDEVELLRRTKERKAAQVKYGKGGGGRGKKGKVQSMQVDDN
jgi:hypothetical protein